MGKDKDFGVEDQSGRVGVVHPDYCFISVHLLTCLEIMKAAGCARPTVV